MSYLKLFQLYYPKIAADLRACSHHYDEKNLNPWHQEGDCWAHTCLVAQELKGTSLEPIAVLHDIGKTQVRYENHEKKRVRFSGHEPMSAFMSLNIFKDWKFTQEQKEKAFQIITRHGEPYQLEAEDMATRLTNQPALAQELYLFGLADHRGRFHEGPDNHEHKLITPKTREIEKFDKEVIFLVGLPGSGKSTYIQENYPRHYVISRDKLVLENGFANDLTKSINSEHTDTLENYSYDRAWNVADQKAVDIKLNAKLQQYGLLDYNVVVDMTNLTRKQRLQKLKYFKGFNKKAIVLLPDLLTTFERLEARKNKTISDEVVKRMIMSFNMPGLDEFDSVEMIFE